MSLLWKFGQMLGFAFYR